MNRRPINVMLVGINGYGSRYLHELIRLEHKGEVRLCAIVDPAAENSPEWPDLQARGVPRFESIEAGVKAGLEAELAAIVSPIPFHADQTCAALAAGMNVLCEKPICATMEDARRMIAARDASGKFLEIGYQWSFTDAIRGLKADLAAGVLGVPRYLQTRVAWPRPDVYFKRNDWAGCIRDASGRIVFDSPVNNATAHFLHNMLFVSGPVPTRSSTPLAIQAECYRANPIKNFDTACCRIETREGPEILFFATHCVKHSIGPDFCFICEQARVEYTWGGDIVAHFEDGRQKCYGNPEGDPMYKLRYCVERCRDEESLPARCGPEAAMAHTLCIEGIQATGVHALPAEQLCYHPEGPSQCLTYLPGLAEAINEGFARRKLFSEMGLPWAREAERVVLPVSRERLFPRDKGGASVASIPTSETDKQGI